MIVGIIGSGTMGSGIAQVAATAGCQVLVYDTNSDALSRSEAKLEKILARLVVKERIDESKKAEIQQNIPYVGDLAALAPCNLTIEAIVENLAIKQKVFAELETYLAARTHTHLALPQP